MLNSLRRWIAWKILRYMYWLEDRPNYSIRWYGLVYSMAHRVYPSTDEDWNKHAPSVGGVGFNAHETELFWGSIEAPRDVVGYCDPDQDKVKTVLEAFRNLEPDQLSVVKAVFDGFVDDKLRGVETERPSQLVLAELQEGLNEASKYARIRQGRKARQG